MEKTGRFLMKCKAHRTPYSIFYGKPGWTRDIAKVKIEEFLQSHCMFSPDCSLDAHVEEEEEKDKQVG